MKLHFGVIVIAFLVASSASAIEPQPSKVTLTPPPIAPSPLINSADGKAEQIAVLHAQLADAEKFQEQILTTVYWSLGTLVGIAVVLVSFGWWTNHRVYDRDKQSLERELRNEIKEASDNLGSHQAAQFEKLAVELSTKLKSETDASERRLGDATKALIGGVKERLGNQVSELELTLGSIQNDVRSLQRASELRERIDWREKKLFRNSLQASVAALKLAVEADDEYAVGNVLDLVAEDISTILKGNGLPIDNYLMAQLAEALDMVKGPHAHAAAALKAKAPKLISG